MSFLDVGEEHQSKTQLSVQCFDADFWKNAKIKTQKKTRAFRRFPNNILIQHSQQPKKKKKKKDLPYASKWKQLCQCARHRPVGRASNTIHLFLCRSYKCVYFSVLLSREDDIIINILFYVDMLTSKRLVIIKYVFVASFTADRSKTCLRAKNNVR